MENIDFNELRDRAYGTAVRHGWHEEDKPLEHFLCLIVGELSEAVEADRKGKRADYANFEQNEDMFYYSFGAYIKDTLEDELADTVIRLLDLAGHLGQDLSGVNVNTSVRHFIGGRVMPLTTRIFQLQSWVVKFYYTQGAYMSKILIEALFELADNLEIDLLKSIELKMKYNEYRPYKHGKRY